MMNKYIFYKYFPRKNIYIGVFEIIKENQEKEYNKMYEFIGASSSNTIDYSEIQRKSFMSLNYLLKINNICTLFTKNTMRNYTKFWIIKSKWKIITKKFDYLKKLSIK